MTLREYVCQYQKSVRVSVRQSIAEELGVLYRTLLAYEFRERPIKPELLVKLEEITNGAVTVEEMRPDILEEQRKLKRKIRETKLRINMLETTQAH